MTYALLFELTLYKTNHNSRCGQLQSAIRGRLKNMLETSARLLRLLSLFQAQRYWTGAHLAERLEVTARTLRRDVDRLRSLGYPVHSTIRHVGWLSARGRARRCRRCCSMTMRPWRWRSDCGRLPAAPSRASKRLPGARWRSCRASCPSDCGGGSRRWMPSFCRWLVLVPEFMRIRSQQLQVLAAIFRNYSSVTTAVTAPPPSGTWSLTAWCTPADAGT